MDYNAISQKIDKFVEEHRRELMDFDIVVGVSRGGLIPAAAVATKLDKMLVAAYIDRQDNVYLDKPDWIAGKRVILIDDICRSGKTMSLMYKLVESGKPESIKTFTLFCLETSKFKPDWTTFIKEDTKLPWD